MDNAMSVILLDFHSRMDAGRSRTAYQERHLILQTLHLLCNMDHLFQRRGDQSR